MKQIVTIFGILLALTVGSASAGEGNLPALIDTEGRDLVAASVKSVDLTLVAAPAALQNEPSDPANELPSELEPATLRERAYTKANAFAGVQVDLPTSPLSIVVAADDLLNPTCGLKLHLVW